MAIVLALMGVQVTAQPWERIQKEMSMLFVNGTNPKDWGGPFGYGTGAYRIANDKEVPFVWYSFYNSDGWAQIAISTKIYGFDLRPVRGFVDQLGRKGVWDAQSVGNLTWIGTSNDMNIGPFDKKYFHHGPWVKHPNGGKTAKVFNHYPELKRDYLDRITAATHGALKFRVVQLDR